MDAAIVYSWQTLYPGRNALAKALAHDSEAYFAELAAAGRCSKLEWFGNGNWTGSQMYIVRGELQELAAISMSPEFTRLNMRGGAILRDPRFGIYLTGESVDVVWAPWWDVVEEIEGA